MNDSVLIIGGSRSGKTTCSNVDVASMAGTSAILYCDPQGNAARDMLQRMFPYENVIVDDLTNTSRVIPMRLLQSSRAHDPTLRRWENRRHREDFAEMLFRKTDEKPHEHPLKSGGVDTAAMVYQTQTQRVPIEALAEAFMPWSPWHAYLVENCADPVHAGLLRRISNNQMHEATRQTLYGPAERILRAVLTEPCIALRDAGDEPDVARLVRDKYVVVVSGGRGVSREAFRMVAATWSLRFIRHFENDGGGSAHVVMDEATNYGLIGEPEIRALNTCMKKGLSYRFIMQSLPKDEEIREALVQNCGKKIAHRCGSRQTAEEVAGWFSSDPEKIHHTTERTVFDGYESVRQTGWASSQPHGFTTTSRDVDRAAHRAVLDRHFVSLSDQRTLLADAILNGTGIGERHVNDNGTCYRETVTLPEEAYPWPGILEDKVQRWIAQLLQSEWCITPAGRIATPPASKRSVKSVPLPRGSSASSDGSVPIRQRTSASRNGRKVGA